MTYQKDNRKNYQLKFDSEIDMLISEAIKEIPFSINLLFRLAILDYLKNIDVKLDWIDYKELIKIKENRTKRRILSSFRNELKSQSLFLGRVKKDIMELIIQKSPLKDVHELIKLRIKECKLYSDKDEEIEQELNKYLMITERDYNQVLEILTEGMRSSEEIFKHKNRIFGLLNRGDEIVK